MSTENESGSHLNVKISSISGDDGKIEINLSSEGNEKEVIIDMHSSYKKVSSRQSDSSDDLDLLNEIHQSLGVDEFNQF